MRQIGEIIREALAPEARAKEVLSSDNLLRITTEIEKRLK